MKKIKVLLFCLLIIIIVYIIYLIFDINVKKNTIEINKDNLLKRISQLGTESMQMPLSELTPFEWDEVYWFGPFARAIDQDKKMGGQRGVNYISPSNDSGSCVAFLKNKQVICYIVTERMECNFIMRFPNIKLDTCYNAYINKSDNPIALISWIESDNRYDITIKI